MKILNESLMRGERNKLYFLCYENWFSIICADNVDPKGADTFHAIEVGFDTKRIEGFETTEHPHVTFELSEEESLEFMRHLHEFFSEKLEEAQK